MKRLIIAFMCCVAAIAATAQIGYQVSLLNNATGEPRANERVTVTVKITDSKGNVLCEETKNETTNDFGVISLSVGNGNTFANADWSSLPFYIEATVDNRLIGKSQLLSVPVAEHAKHTGTLTKEILCSKTWRYSNYEDMTLELTFYRNNTCHYKHREEYGEHENIDEYDGYYEIDGNTVSVVFDDSYAGFIKYIPDRNSMIYVNYGYYLN